MRHLWRLQSRLTLSRLLMGLVEQPNYYEKMEREIMILRMFDELRQTKGFMVEKEVLSASYDTKEISLTVEVIVDDPEVEDTIPGRLDKAVSAWSWFGYNTADLIKYLEFENLMLVSIGENHCG